MNEVLTVFLCKFNSPYIGNIDSINGHSIYNSLLLNVRSIKASNVLKVSHGIFHTLELGVRSPFYQNPFGSNYDNMSFTSNCTIKKDKIKKYGGFFVSRDSNNPFGEGNKLKLGRLSLKSSPEKSVIRNSILKSNMGDIKCYHPEIVSFFTITNGDIEIPNKMSVGAMRNDGFGEICISDHASFPLNDIELPFDNKNLKNTAINGIRGIGTYKKYGYGEFRIFPVKNKWLLEFTTPYCIDNEYRFPSFLKKETYRPKTDILWNKGRSLKIESIDSGQQFELTGVF